MPLLKKAKNLKLFHSISEVADMFGIAESTLRYWEKEFPSLHPKTTQSGIRQYREQDIEEVRLIHDLIKVRGFRISNAKKMLSANRGRAADRERIVTMLTVRRDELMDICRHLDGLVALSPSETDAAAPEVSDAAKPFYTIGEVADMFGITDSTLRFWEKEFPTLRPKTADNGTRQYTQEDIDEVRVLYNMLKVRGLRIANAREMLASDRTMQVRGETVITTLTRCRDELQDMKTRLDRLV